MFTITRREATGSNTFYLTPMQSEITESSHEWRPRSTESKIEKSCVDILGQSLGTNPISLNRDPEVSTKKNTWHQHIFVRHRRHSKWCSGRIQVCWSWVTHVWFWWIIYQNRNSKHHTISGLSVLRFVTWRWVYYLVEIIDRMLCSGKEKM